MYMQISIYMYIYIYTYDILHVYLHIIRAYTHTHTSEHTHTHLNFQIMFVAAVLLFFVVGVCFLSQSFFACLAGWSIFEEVILACLVTAVAACFQIN